MPPSQRFIAEGGDQRMQEWAKVFPNGRMAGRTNERMREWADGRINLSITRPGNRRAMGKPDAHFLKIPPNLLINELANELGSDWAVRKNTAHYATMQYNITHYIITY